MAVFILQQLRVALVALPAVVWVLSAPTACATVQSATTVPIRPLQQRVLQLHALRHLPIRLVAAVVAPVLVAVASVAVAVVPQAEAAVEAVAVVVMLVVADNSE